MINDDALRAVRRAVAETIAAHPALVEDVRRRTPKAWGALAAKVVLAHRDALGRPPTDAERRALWEGLWDAVHAERG